MQFACLERTPVVPVACFQSRISVNVFSGLVLITLGEKNSRHGKQKAASFLTEYSNQEYCLYQSDLNDLALPEKYVTGYFICSVTQSYRDNNHSNS